MPSLLIVSYYWPPAGGVAVQRILKTARYLKDLGWEITVLTVDNGQFDLQDPTLISEVSDVPTLRPKSFEPQRWLSKSKRSGSKPKKSASSEKKSSRRIQFFLQLVRLNLFIPDSRVGWIRPAIKEAEGWILENKPDAILSTAPPYSSHFVAKALSKRFNVPWVADFRDPWLENLAYNVAPRLGVVKSITRMLEKKILRSADRVTCTGWNLGELYKSKVSDEHHSKFSVIPNGYDVDRIFAAGPLLSKFTLTYVGTVYSTGLPLQIFDAIADLIRENPSFASDFSLRFIGKIENDAEDQIRARIPAAYVEMLGFVGSDRVQEFLQEQQVLLSIMYDVSYNECITLGKVFDYLKTQNPILSIAPKSGDTTKILSEFEVASLDASDLGGIKCALLSHHKAWKSEGLLVSREINEKFTRKYQAKQFDSLIKKTIEKKDA